jgi:hypothetical protein
LSPSRIAVIVMEDKEYPSIIGTRDAPYINSLAQTYGLATEFYAVAPHGLFDYLALIGGSTFRSCPTCPVTHVSAPNLVDQLEDAGVSWKAYMEDLPGPCFKKASYRRYVKRHDPFLYFDSIAQDRDRCAKVVPYPELATDIARRTVPMFVWISPNMCHNSHDCSVATGDAFLSKLVPKLLRALRPDGVLFLTWDEGLTKRGCCRYATGGHIVTIVAGPGAKRGFRSDTPFDHYSILRTIEEAWGFDLLGKAACRCTRSMRVFCRTSCRARG